MQTYITLSAITILLSAMLAWNIRRRFPDGSYRWFVMTLLSVLAWSAFSVAEALAASAGWKTALATLQYPGIVSLPICTFLFSCEFTDHRRFLSDRSRWLLWIEPGLVLLLVATNPLHHLYWTAIRTAAPVDGFATLAYGRGWPFYLHTAYSYGFIVVAMLRMLWHLLRSRQLSHHAPAVISMAAPLLSNLLYLAGITPLDFSAPAISITCIGFAGSIIARDIEARAELERKVAQSGRMAGIGRLAAGIAHEINNPLGYVKSNLATLEKYILRLCGLMGQYENLLREYDQLDAAARRQRIEEIDAYLRANRIDTVLTDAADLARETNEGIRRIEAIVRSIMGYAGVAGTDQIGAYDLNEGIRSLLPLLSCNEGKDIRILLEPGKAPPVRADADDMSRILFNLTGNAIQAVQEKGGGTVTLRTGGADGHAFCEIRDDGVGIPAANLPFVFDPFFTTQPVGGGMGLGLSITRDLVVHKYGGDITVRSSPEAGTVFRFELPADPIRDSGKGPIPQTVRTGSPNPPGGSA